MSAAPILKVYQDGEELRSVSLKEEVWIGRDEACVIRLNDRAVSRKHLLLKPLANGVQIERKSKFSPLLVNGVEKEQALAKAGDVISIGPYLVKFEFPVSTENTVNTAVDGDKTDLHASLGATQTASEPSAEAVFPEQNDVEIPEPSITLTREPSLLSGIDNAAPSLSIEGDKTALFDTSGLKFDQQEQVALAAGPVESLPAFSVEEVPSQVSTSAPTPAEASSPATPMNTVKDVTFSLSGQSIEHAETKVVTTSKLAAVLEFPEGSANVKELVIDQDEVSVGRGQECNVVLNDKKSSRKHATISRNGTKFVIKDLKSMNGTLVDGEKITEKELNAEHTIKIGEVSFQFRAFNTDYMKDEADFLKMPDFVAGAVSANSDTAAVENVPQYYSAPTGGASSLQSAVPGTTGQIDFMPPPSLPSGKPASLAERFKRYPPLMKGIVILLLVMVGVLLFSDLEETPEKKPKPAEAAKTATATAQNPAKPDEKPSIAFESLPEETKKIIRSQHQLAFEHLKNKEYDKALFEVRKIFQYIPDYQDAREIERYSLEGKRKLEAMEEERKRKEEEARIKERVVKLSQEIDSLMQAKNFPQARELITELLTLDPEGEDTIRRKNDLARFEEDARLANENQAIQAQLKAEGWKRYRAALAQQKAEKWRNALRSYQELLAFGVSDKKLLDSTYARVKECKDAIQAIYDPLIQEASQLETSGDYRKAYDTYQKARAMDPTRKEARDGMERIQTTLHEQAKVFYTEAVLAESYSDFATARTKYEDVLKTAPENDVYRERAQRKLKGYFIKRETASQ